MTREYRRPRPGVKPKKVKNMMRLYAPLGDRRTKKSRYVGKHSKLGLFRFIADVLTENENLPREQKLTNFAICQLIIDEFPTHKVLIQGLRKNTKGVNYYRDLYNRGRLHNDEPPPRISYRYNELGQVVDMRSGTRLWTAQERAAYARKYFGIHSELKAKQQFVAQVEKELGNETQSEPPTDGGDSNPGSES